MTRIDNHKLVNLSIGVKIVSTAALLFGLGLFFSASFFEVLFASWGASIGDFVRWGALLTRLRAQSPTLFWAFFAAHALSLILILVVANILFHRVSMARGARRALVGVTMLLGALDLLSWTLLTVLPVVHHTLGPIVALLSICLLYLIGRPVHEMWIYRRWKNKTGQKVRVVFVGGGFAGLYAAMGLDRILGYHRDLEIIVIDKRNYFLFPPLLPSVAAGAIETRQVTYPFRRIFEATNVIFKKELVRRIDCAKKVIVSRVDVDEDPTTRELKVISCETPYDYLVLAPGSDTNTFGTPGVVEHAFFMRELGDAVAVRNHIIDCFEHAARETEPSRRQELLSFIMVGAGPTGVELASEVRDLIEHVLLRRYPEVDRRQIRVYMIQSGGQILPGWHTSIVEQASRQLATLNIEVLLNRRVTGVDAFGVTLDDGRRIPTRTCVWCAGVKPAAILRSCDLPKHTSGRIPIEDDLRVKGHSDVFVLGDAAFLIDKGKPLPPLGQVAFQQGSHAAETLVRLIKGKRTRPFKYFNFGSLVSVGEHFAAIDLLGVRLSGFLAWLVWRTLYLMKLVGFANRVRVVLDWTLDLLVERSISQIAVSRQELKVESLAETVPLPPAPPR
jgi:NADH dehydrogenase